MITFEYDIKDIERFVLAGHKSIELFIKFIAEDLWGNIKRESPVDQGRLAGSWLLQQAGTTTYRIWSGVNYAEDVYKGKPPNSVTFTEIAPWAHRHNLPPGAIFGSIRKHGTRPNPYVDRAFALTQGRVDDFGEKALLEAQR